MRTLLSAIVGLAIALGPTWAAAKERALTVFAAASLTDALKDISAAWQRARHEPLRMSFASSSLLARQIEQGAPADLFASADDQWMDYLFKAGLVVDDTRKALLSNSLVLVVPKDAAHPVAIGPAMDLTSLLGATGRMAIADPAHVPAGIYARQALTKLGLWPAVEGRLARAEDVRGALLLVERGEAPAGIVYATDAAASPGVTVAGTLPEETHDRITYPFAITRAGDGPEARALLAFLAGPEAKDVFARRGFILNAEDDATGNSIANRFREANVSHDGRLTLDEARAARLRRVVQDFDAIDRTHKGYVTLGELQAWRAR